MVTSKRAAGTATKRLTKSPHVRATAEVEKRQGELERLRPELEAAEEQAKAEFAALLGQMEAVERQGLALGRVLRKLHGGELTADGTKSPRLYALRGLSGGWDAYLTHLMGEVEKQSPAAKKLSTSWSYDLMKASQTADDLSVRTETVSPRILEQLTPRQLVAAARYKDPAGVVAGLSQDDRPPSVTQIKAFGEAHPDQLLSGRKSGAVVSAEHETPPSVVRWADRVGVDGIGRLMRDRFIEEVPDLIVWLVGTLNAEEREQLMERLGRNR